MLKKITLTVIIICSIIGINSEVFGNPKMKVEVGLNHFYKNRYLEAFREFKSALDEDPNYPEAHYNIGRVYKLQGFNKEALMEFQKAVQIKPDYLAAKRELEALKKLLEQDINAQLKMQGKDSVSNTTFDTIPSGEIETKARELLNQGKTEEATKYYELLLKERPNDTAIYKMLGFLYYRQNKFTNSLENYTNAEKLTPGDAEIPYSIGLIYMKTRAYKQSETYFQKAIKLYPKMVKAYFSLGESYEAQGKIDDAVFQFKKCLEINPSLKEATNKLNYLAGKQSYNYFSRGSYYYQRGDYENALSLLSMSRSYGNLTNDQIRQADEMINTCKYWVDKQQAEKKKKVQMEEIRNEANVSRAIILTEVTRNANPYIGRAVEWSGSIEDIKRNGNKASLIVNTNNEVDAKVNLDFCFKANISRKLIQDSRISTNSDVTVVGKILNVNKIQIGNIFSSKRQPIIEVSEITFIRKGYDEPLIIRF